MANNKVKKIAQAMARADGHNPDAPLQQKAVVLGQEIRIVMDRTMLAWEYYEVNARSLLAGIQAAVAFDEGDE